MRRTGLARRPTSAAEPKVVEAGDRLINWFENRRSPIGWDGSTPGRAADLRILSDVFQVIADALTQRADIGAGACLFTVDDFVADVYDRFAIKPATMGHVGARAVNYARTVLEERSSGDIPPDPISARDVHENLQKVLQQFDRSVGAFGDRLVL